MKRFLLSLTLWPGMIRKSLDLPLLILEHSSDRASLFFMMLIEGYLLNMVLEFRIYLIHIKIIIFQTFHRSSAQIDVDCWAGSSRRYRPRINSAIFISNSGPGFETGEFLRRHGSSSKLCRKAQSEENIPLTDTTPKHFGLPVLSISGPSPPEEIDEHEEESFDQDDDEQNEEKLVKQNSNNTYDSFDQQSSFEQCI